ncbi:MAG: GGDEF domain-containing protein [Clostridiales bacterium]|nr:GGDEF domain-containing protein [Clostridiales bacterium]
MEMNFTFFYVEANIVCIIILAMILLRSWGKVDRQQKQRIFDGIVISHICYFICDIFWVQILNNALPHTRVLASIVNILNADLLSSITCFWFVYVELSQGEKYIVSSKGRGIASLPALLEVLIMIVLFIFFNDKVLDEDNAPTALYYVLFVAIPAIYVAAAASRSLSRAIKKENYAYRFQYILWAVYPMIVTVIGILQTLWLNAPLFCFGSVITLLYVYMVSTDDLISMDPLTKLNNRAQLRRYLATEIAGNTHYVMMMDLNKFKHINDKYGHMEGDIAIQRTADALRSACSENQLRPFIARYGGDEFIIIAKTNDENKIRELADRISAKLIELNKESGAPYELSASIGYSSYNGDIAEFPSALSKADEALYINKAMSHAEAAEI